MGIINRITQEEAVAINEQVQEYEHNIAEAMKFEDRRWELAHRGQSEMPQVVGMGEVKKMGYSEKTAKSMEGLVP